MDGASTGIYNFEVVLDCLDITLRFLCIEQTQRGWRTSESLFTVSEG